MQSQVVAHNYQKTALKQNKVVTHWDASDSALIYAWSFVQKLVQVFATFGLTCPDLTRCIPQVLKAFRAGVSILRQRPHSLLIGPSLSKTSV